MTSSYYYTPDGQEVAEEVVYPNNKEETDWDKLYKLNGWDRHDHYGGEFALFEAEIYHRRGAEFLVEISTGYGGVIAFYCVSRMEMYGVVKEHVLPLISANSNQTMTEWFDRAAHILFDGQEGLQCAQRVYARDERREEYYRSLAKEREAKEKAKAS